MASPASRKVWYGAVPFFCSTWQEHYRALRYMYNINREPFHASETRTWLLLLTLVITITFTLRVMRVQCFAT